MLFGKRQPKAEKVDASTPSEHDLQLVREEMDAAVVGGGTMGYLEDPKWDQRAPTPYVDRFEEICADMIALHNQKGADYGSGTDPYANVRASEEFGVPAWIGALIRMNDKITRLKSFIRQGKLVNESAFDSIRDIAVYAIIMRILYEEQTAAPVREWAKNNIMQAGLKAMMEEPGTPWADVKAELGLDDERPFPDFDPPIVYVPVDPDPDHSNEQEHVPEPATMLDQTPQVAACWCDMEPVKPHQPHLAAVNFDVDLTFDKDQNPIAQKYVILADGGREWM